MRAAPRASLREEQRTLTRNRVLDAATAVFAAKSFVDATMDDIARAAGVTRVTVYAHFPGKSDIIQALAGRVYDTLGEVHAELAALPRWSRPAIRRWLDGAAARWRAMAPTLRVVHVASAAVARDPAHSRDRYREAQARHVAMLVADAGRWPGIPPAEARQRALMVILQTESFLSAWIAAELPIDTGDPLDLLAGSLCHLLGPAGEDSDADPSRDNPTTAVREEHAPD